MTYYCVVVQSNMPYSTSAFVLFPSIDAINHVGLSNYYTEMWFVLRLYSGYARLHECLLHPGSGVKAASPGYHSTRNERANGASGQVCEIRRKKSPNHGV